MVRSQCFKEGTLVACLNESGEEVLTPIESIAVGTLVLAYDEITGEQAYKPVVRLFRNETKEWYHIYVNGEEIICTGGHPFYVAENGKFIPAQELKVGSKLLLSTGVCAIIETIQVEQLVASETTYNFEVEDFHTYYVSDCKVLVHNMCGTPDTAPEDFTKLKNGQGWRDKKGNVWKKDMLHKDHWDVSNKKGIKIKEINFNGSQIWPGGPKNRNKW